MSRIETFARRSSVLALRKVALGLALITVVIGTATETAMADEETEDTRLVAYVSPTRSDNTHLAGGPIQLMVSVVNQKLERANQTHVESWREEVRQIEATGGISTPEFPHSLEVTADLEVDLGTNNLQWFDQTEVRVEDAATGQKVFAGIDWADQVSYPFALFEEPTRLGDSPEWVTMEITPEMSATMAPGEYRLVAEGPWGNDSWTFTVSAPNSESQQAELTHLQARWELTYGSPETGVQLASEAVASLADTDIEVVLTLAQALHVSGRKEEALAEYERYVATKSQHPRACYELESARQTLESLRAELKGE